MDDIKISLEYSRNNYFIERTEESFDNYVVRLQAVKIMSLEHSKKKMKRKLKKLLKDEYVKYEKFVNDVSVVMAHDPPTYIYEQFVAEVVRKHYVMEIIN